MKKSDFAQPFVENYRFTSIGIVKVYGNSVEIEEHTDALNRKQIRSWIERENEYIRDVNKRFDEKFKEHVLTYGMDFENHPLWFNGKNYYPQKDEPQKPQKPVAPKRERGDIIGFSKKSRYRMQKRMNRLDFNNLQNLYSVTLTYPKRFPEDGETHKTDLDVMLKRFKRRFGKDIEYLWKLEFQKRGAPHYHILIRLPKKYKLPYLQKWLGKNWYEVAQRFWDEKQTNHLDAGTQFKELTSREGKNSIKSAAYYLCKYINKEEESTPKHQGRYWGYSRNWGVLLHEAELTGRELIQFRRLVKKYVKRNNRRMSKMVSLPVNITIFGHWGVFVQALEWIEKVH